MADYEYVSFEDFSGGEYGELGGFRAPQNSFTGTNVVLYSDGLLGPRPGLANITPGSVPTGKVWGIFSPQLTSKPLMVVIGSGIYASSAEVGSLSLQASFGAAPQDYVQADWYDPNGNIYIMSPHDHGYVINWTSGALSNLNTNGGSTATGWSMALCRDRLYAIGRPTYGTGAVGNGATVYYSDAANFTTFANSFDVSYFWDVYGAVQIQNSLLFGLRTGGWFALVGSTPSGELRQVDTFLSPGKQHEITAGENGQVYFWSGWNGSNSQDPTLCVTNGAKFDGDTYKHLRLSGADRFGTYFARTKSLLFVSSSGNAAMYYINGAWHRFDFSVALSGPNCTTGLDNWGVLVGGDSGGTSAKFYAFLNGLDRPGGAGDTVLAQPGDGSTTPVNAYFFMPVFQHAKARDMRVRRVIVDFKKWNLAVAGGNNSMTCRVHHISKYNLAAGTQDDYSISTQTWTEGESNAATSGTFDRHIFNVGDQGYCGAFQVGFQDLVGVAIQRITVEFESVDGRPR